MDSAHKISKLTAILITMNIMIGVGVYIVPVSTSKLCGNLSFLSWPLITAIFLPVVYSIAQITKYFETGGSFYHYAKQEFGKNIGFINGWTYFLGFAAVSSLLSLKLRDLFISKLGLSMSMNNILIFNAVIILIFCLLNLLNLKHVGKIQNLTTLIKLTPLLFIILLLFFYWNPNLAFDIKDMSNLQFTIPLSIFGFLGFEAACSISHLIEGDKNTPSKVILISFLGTALIYTIFHLSLLHIMGPDNLIKYDSLGVIKFLNLKNPLVYKIISSIFSSAIFVAYASTIFGCVLTSSSNLHIMLDNNLLPKSNTLKKLTRSRRPKYAILLTGLTVFILMTFANKITILSALCNFGIVTTYALTLLSLLSIQIKKRAKSRIIITLISILSSLLIIGYSWVLIGFDHIERLKNFLPFMILATTGFILFKYNEKNNKN